MNWTYSIATLAVIDLWVLKRCLILRNSAHVSESFKDLHSLVILGFLVISLKFGSEPAAASHEGYLDDSHDQKACSFCTHICSVTPIFQILIGRPFLIFGFNEIIIRDKIIDLIFAEVPVVFQRLVVSVLHYGENEVEINPYKGREPTEVAWQS